MDRIRRSSRVWPAIEDALTNKKFTVTLFDDVTEA
jgi:hypothetical protein